MAFCAIFLAIAALQTCLPALASNENDFMTRCLSFTPALHIYNSSIRALEYVPSGRNLTFPYNDVTCARPSQVVAVDLCRVALSIPTSDRSSISFELWLPENWSGRFLGTGNGGIDGCLYFSTSLKRRNRDLC